jgi:hypothetical protein
MITPSLINPLAKTINEAGKNLKEAYKVAAQDLPRGSRRNKPLTPVNGVGKSLIRKLIN